MLIWLGDKEKNIASTAIAIFIGSWLLLFCQTCFATLESNELIALSDSGVIEHCHQTDIIIKVDDQSAQDSDHCIGPCGGDDIPALLSSAGTVKSSDKINNKSFDDNISVLFIEPEQDIVQTIYPIAIFPEQAILLPLKNLTVLLI
jgi:hypothetical protein